MAISYPSSLDDFTNPASGDQLNSPSHSQQHIDINDAVEALEAKVGVDSSADATSIDYQLNDFIDQKGVANGLATLDAGGKIPSAQLPALALTDIFSVASEAAQIALTAQEGDVAIRTDLNKSYVHNGGSAGTMDDWSELLTPTDLVLSVAGKTGAVSLDSSDVGLGNVTNEAQIAKSIGTAAGDIIYFTGSGVPARLGVGTAGQVLTVNSGATAPEWADASGGGTSLWTAITGTRASNTTITVSGDQTAIFKKGMIVRWKESGVDKVGMVSIPSTYSSPNTTITIIGDTCASIDSGTFKYSVILGAEPYIARFAYAGTVGATATDVMNAYYATEPMKVIGVDLQVGTVASTSGTTTLDLNKNGTTMFTTKATLAYNVASSPTPFTADTATSLALGDRVSVDIDGVTSTTFPVDLYVQLYLFPTRFLTLS